MAKIIVTIPSGFEGDIMPAVRAAVADALPSIAAFALDRLGQYADGKLRTAAADYRRGFGAESLEMSEEGFTVVPSTELAKALEGGYDAFDLKAALLKSPGVKTSKDGSKYVDVPFRHGASAKSVRLQGMPADIKRLVDNSMARERRGAKKEGRPIKDKTRVTGSLKAKPPHWKDLRYGDDAVPHLVEHKTSIYSAMIRSGTKSHTQYNTIRRISEKSDADSWMHPGFPGVHGIPKVMGTLERTAVQTITMELRKRGLNVK